MPFLPWEQLQRESESATDAAKTASASASVISAASSAANREAAEKTNNGSVVKFEDKEEADEADELRGEKSAATLKLEIWFMCTAFLIQSVAMFCYGFLLKLRGPAWAVANYSISQPAGEIFP